MNIDTTQKIVHDSNSAKSNLSATLLGARRRHNSTSIRRFFHRLSIAKSTDPSRCPIMNSSMDQDAEPTQKQIDLIRLSWERVSEIRHDTDDRNVSASHAFGLAFYDALFEMDPDCKQLFDNVFQQSTAFTGMISYIARSPHVMNNKNSSAVTRRPPCCGGSAAGASIYAPKDFDSPPSTPTTIKDINARKKATSFDSSQDNYNEGDPEWLALQMRELGARHYLYKVKPHQLELVGPAFASALKNRLRHEYTTEIGDAWIKANSYAAYNMKIGLHSQQAWDEGNTNSRSTRKKAAACIIQ